MNTNITIWLLIINSVLNAVGLLQMFCDPKERGNPWHLNITCTCQDASCIKTLTLHPNHHLQISFQLCSRNCASSLSGQMEIIMPWLNSSTMSWRISLYKISSYFYHVHPNHLTCLAVSKGPLCKLVILLVAKWYNKSAIQMQSWFHNISFHLVYCFIMFIKCLRSQSLVIPKEWKLVKIHIQNE